ncbi:MAG: creatininase family protein [Pseudomonadota bacterium]
MTDIVGPKWVEKVEPANPETLFILPLGATEQHGPHLPLETDSIIARGICDRLLPMLPKEADIRILPVEQIGYSLEHMDHEGSQTLTFDEAVNRWVGIGESIAQAGGRKLLMMNAHGGNSPLMTIVAQELRVRHNLLAVATSWTRCIKGTRIVSPAEEAFGIHGGEIETAVMLSLAPQKVDMKRAMDFPNLQEALALDYKHLRAYGPHAFGWKAADLNRFGVTGRAGVATRETGEALLSQATAGLTELVAEIMDFNLPCWEG